MHDFWEAKYALAAGDKAAARSALDKARAKLPQLSGTARSQGEKRIADLAGKLLIPMPGVLLTGFEPFQQQASNPSSRLARALHGQLIAGRRVVGVELACLFQTALTQLRQHLQLLQPELVLCLGQAGGRSAISLERVAINIVDASIPDNAGESPVDQPIEPQGPVAYWSRLPLKAILQALRQANIPAEVSQSAGTFVCNHVFYGLMHSLAPQSEVRGGFIHVPYTPEQGQPHLPLPVMRRALEIAIEVSLTTGHDLCLSGGATH